MKKYILWSCIGVSVVVLIAMSVAPATREPLLAAEGGAGARGGGGGGPSVAEGPGRDRGQELLERLAASERDGGFAGCWDTGFGVMDIRTSGQGSLRARYGERGGRVSGEVAGRVFTGHWYEKDNPAQTCKETRFGTRHWGRMRLTLDEGGEAFEGTWCYGEDGVERGWTGRRVQTLRAVAAADIRQRLEKALALPGLMAMPEKLALSWDEAIEDWMEDYAPGGKESYEHLAPDDPQATQGRARAGGPGPKEGYLPGEGTQTEDQRKMRGMDPTSIQILEGMQESADRLRDELRKRPKLTQTIHDRIAAEIDKHFPEFRGVVGAEGFDRSVAKMAKIVERHGGTLDALSPGIREKLSEVFDRALDGALDPGARR